MARLAEMVGQAGVCRLFRRLVQRQRLPHAVLLEGLPGCGRRTLALALARALLCSAPRDGDSCGACPACVLVGQGTHPDLVCLAHDSEADLVEVDAVREQVVQAAQESALLGATRVFVLFGVERYQGAAANALLKVLEEPPPGVYLLMTTNHAGGVLKTIRSRAQLYRLEPLSAVDLAAVLERGGLSAAVAAARAAQGGGSHRGLRQQQELAAPLDILLRLCRGEFHSQLVAELVAALPQRERKDEDGQGRTLASEQRLVCRQWLNALLQRLRAELRGPQALRHAELAERVLQLQRDLQRNLNPRLVLEALAQRG